jgi:phenylacetate-CoA ligase
MNELLAKHLIYPLYQISTGRRILSKWREFERTQWLPQHEIEALQRRRLHNLLNHAYRHVPFYRKRLEALGYKPESPLEPETFQELPLLTKSDILSHRDEMVAEDFSPAMLKLDATGGSTGHTLTFYHDRASLDNLSAVTIANRLTNRVLNRLFLDCFRLSDELLADYVDQLRRFRPKVLLGYATALATMAQYLEAREIRDIHLHAVISSAETLFDAQRRQIEGVFGCKVYNRYGCREAGPLVVECAEGSLHINTDYVYLELLRDGQPAQPGEVGEIVITPLHRYGMPLIRYQIGDLGIAASQAPCACGRGLPIVERIVGRTSDMLVNASGDFFHGEYFTHLLYHQPGVRQFQVVQPDARHLVFKIVIDQDFNQDLLKDLEEKILAFVGSMNIQWQLVDEIPPFKSGKRSFTVSMVPVEFATSNGSSD